MVSFERVAGELRPLYKPVQETRDGSFQDWVTHIKSRPKPLT